MGIDPLSRIGFPVPTLVVLAFPMQPAAYMIRPKIQPVFKGALGSLFCLQFEKDVSSALARWIALSMAELQRALFFCRALRVRQLDISSHFGWAIPSIRHALSRPVMQ